MNGKIREGLVLQHWTKELVSQVEGIYERKWEGLKVVGVVNQHSAALNFNSSLLESVDEIPIDVIDTLSTEADNKNKGTGFMNVAAEQNSSLVSEGSVLEADTKLPPSMNMDKSAGIAGIDGSGVSHDETPKTCQLEFGSYCLWCKEHKEDMKDSMVKKLKGQLFVARAYFPSIAKLPKQDKLSRDMKSNIQDFERMLSDATTDVNLPLE
ncbi:hypothetical protein ACLOJK_031591 [Asimina triloba]